MKNVEVVAAIIQNESVYLATQRGYGDLKGGWEFPGGKVEAGETPEQALVREIHEELDVELNVGRFVTTVEYDYPAFHLIMHCYLCTVAKGHLHLLEHSAARWFDRSSVDDIEWLPADIKVVRALKDQDLL